MTPYPLVARPVARHRPRWRRAAAAGLLCLALLPTAAHPISLSGLLQLSLEHLMRLEISAPGLPAKALHTQPGHTS